MKTLEILLIIPFFHRFLLIFPMLILQKNFKGGGLKATSLPPPPLRTPLVAPFYMSKILRILIQITYSYYTFNFEFQIFLILLKFRNQTKNLFRIENKIFQFFLAAQQYGRSGIALLTARDLWYNRAFGLNDQNVELGPQIDITNLTNEKRCGSQLIVDFAGIDF